MYKNLLRTIFVSASPIWGRAAQPVIGKLQTFRTVITIITELPRLTVITYCVSNEQYRHSVSAV